MPLSQYNAKEFSQFTPRIAKQRESRLRQSKVKSSSAPGPQPATPPAARVAVPAAAPTETPGPTQCVTADTLLPVICRQPVAGKLERWKTTLALQPSSYSASLQPSSIEYISIVEVKPGDYVLSLNEETQAIEPHRIKGLLDMGVKPVYKLITASGRTIKTTANHPYLVRAQGAGYRVQETAAGRISEPRTQNPEPRKWTKVSELKEGMEIAAASGTFNATAGPDKFDPIPTYDQQGVCGEKENFAFDEWLQNFYKGTGIERIDFKEHNSLVAAQRESIEAIKVGIQSEKDSIHFVTKGNNFSIAGALQPRFFCSGDLIATFPQKLYSAAKETMVSQEFHLVNLLNRNLFVFQDRSSVMQAGLDILNGYIRIAFFDDSLGSQPLLNQFNNHINRDSRSRDNRFSEAHCRVNRNSFRQIISHFIYLQQQIYHRLKEASSFITDAYAQPAAENAILWDKIVSIEPLPPERVYDIEVEGTHNFVANGIIAHNTAIFPVAAVAAPAAARPIIASGATDELEPSIETITNKFSDQGIIFIHGIYLSRPLGFGWEKAALRNTKVADILARTKIALTGLAVLSGSFIKPGCSGKNMASPFGLIFKRGMITAISGTDAGTSAHIRNEIRHPSPEVAAKLMNLIKEWKIPSEVYNFYEAFTDLSFSDPEAAGIYISLDEDNRSLRESIPMDAISNLASTFGLPTYVIEKGVVFIGIYNEAGKTFTKGTRVSSLDILNNGFLLGDVKKGEILRELLQDYPFRTISPEMWWMQSRLMGRVLYTVVNKDNQDLSEPQKTRLRETNGVLKKSLATWFYFTNYPIPSELPIRSFPIRHEGPEVMFKEGINSSNEYCDAMNSLLALAETLGRSKKELSPLVFNLYGFAEQAREVGDEQAAKQAEEIASRFMPLHQYEEIVARRDGGNFTIKADANDLIRVFSGSDAAEDEISRRIIYLLTLSKPIEGNKIEDRSSAVLASAAAPAVSVSSAIAPDQPSAPTAARPSYQTPAGATPAAARPSETTLSMVRLEAIGQEESRHKSGYVGNYYFQKHEEGTVWFSQMQNMPKEVTFINIDREEKLFITSGMATCSALFYIVRSPEGLFVYPLHMPISGDLFEKSNQMIISKLSEKFRNIADISVIIVPGLFIASDKAQEQSRLAMEQISKELVARRLSVSATLYPCVIPGDVKLDGWLDRAVEAKVDDKEIKISVVEYRNNDSFPQKTKTFLLQLPLIKSLRDEQKSTTARPGLEGPASTAASIASAAVPGAAPEPPAQAKIDWQRVRELTDAAYRSAIALQGGWDRLADEVKAEIGNPSELIEMLAALRQLLSPDLDSDPAVLRGKIQEVRTTFSLAAKITALSAKQESMRSGRTEDIEEGKPSLSNDVITALGALNAVEYNLQKIEEVLEVTAPTPPAAGANEKKAPDNAGGINLTAMPIVTQPLSGHRVPGTGYSAPNPEPRTPNPDFSLQQQELQRLLNAGIIPSSERMKQYLISCCQQLNYQQELDKALVYVAHIFRLEEERDLPSGADLKGLLFLIESGKPTQELALAASKIEVLSY
ncbi:MAG: hypothetical protein WC658_00855 [Candidatus Omnitrophota bacterium]